MGKVRGLDKVGEIISDIVSSLQGELKATK